MAASHGFIEYVKKAALFATYGYSKAKHTRSTGQTLVDAGLHFLGYVTPADTLPACDDLFMDAAKLEAKTLPQFLIKCGDKADVFLAGTWGESTCAKRIFMLMSFIKLLAKEMPDDKEVREFQQAKEAKLKTLLQDNDTKNEATAKQRAYLDDFSAIKKNNMQEYFKKKVKDKGPGYEYFLAKNYDDQKPFDTIDDSKPLELHIEYLWFFCKQILGSTPQSLHIAVQSIKSLSNVDFKSLHEIEMQQLREEEKSKQKGATEQLGKDLKAALEAKGLTPELMTIATRELNQKHEAELKKIHAELIAKATADLKAAEQKHAQELAAAKSTAPKLLDGKEAHPSAKTADGKTLPAKVEVDAAKLDSQLVAAIEAKAIAEEKLKHQTEVAALQKTLAEREATIKRLITELSEADAKLRKITDSNSAKSAAAAPKRLTAIGEGRGPSLSSSAPTHDSDEDEEEHTRTSPTI